MAQRVGQHRVSSGKLGDQRVAQFAFGRLQQPVRVAGDQADDLCADCAAVQVPGAVERVESGVGDGRTPETRNALAYARALERVTVTPVA